MFDLCGGKMLTLYSFANNSWLIHRKWVKLLYRLYFSEFFFKEEYFGSNFSNICTSLSFDPCTTFDLWSLKLPKVANCHQSDPERTLPQLLFPIASYARSRFRKWQLCFYSTVLQMLLHFGWWSFCWLNHFPTSSLRILLFSVNTSNWKEWDTLTSCAKWVSQ